MFFHPYAQDFHLTGDYPYACLILHGFSGSPGQLRPLGNAVFKNGMDVHAILLKGHGTDLRDLQGVKWHDWLKESENTYLQLKEKYQKVFVIGFSLGGVLTLLLSEKYIPDKIVLISTPVKLQNAFLVSLLPLFRYFIRYWSFHNKKKLRVDLYDVDYTKFPLQSFYEVVLAKQKAVKKLPLIKSPALIIQSFRDEAVKPVSAEIIYNNILSTDKNILWLQDSAHLCVLGRERHVVFNEINDFLSAQ